MATVEEVPTIPSDEMADMEQVCRLIAAGNTVKDPALLKRIYERSAKVQKEIRDKHGVVEWAVDLIREARDEV
jgi:hypothetical protein